VIDFALRKIGLKPWEFWEMTWPEFDSVREAYFLGLERQWDHTRHIMTIIHNVNCAKRSQQITPQKMMHLSFDPPKENILPPTEEEKNEMLQNAGFTLVDGEWVQTRLTKN